MARPIYSWLFQLESISGGGVTVVPLDPLYTYVLRDATGLIVSNPDDSAGVEVNLDGNTVLKFAAADLWAVPFSWQGHIVAPGTSSLEIVGLGSGGFTNVALSGYRLSA